MQIDHKFNNGYIRLPEVLELIPVGRSTWWKGVQDGRFPKGYKIGPRTTAWKAEEIQGLLESFQSGGSNE